MAEQQLVDYIKKAREAKQADDQTKSLLSKNGWTQSEVSDAFAAIDQPVSQPVAQSFNQAEVDLPQEPVELDIANSKTQPLEEAEDKLEIESEEITPEPEPVLQPQQRPVYQPQAQTQPQPQPQVQYQPMPKMRKSHAILKILVVLIVLLVVGGAVYVAYQNYPMATQPPVPVFSTAEKAEIVSCNRLASPRSPILCIVDLAVKNSKVAFCDQLGPSGNNQIAAANVPTIKAYCQGMVNKNASLCTQKDVNLKNNCLDGVASANLDVTLCSQVKTGSCTEWIAIKTGNTDLCKTMPQTSVESCYYKVAVASKTAATCDLVTDKAQKTSCVTDVARISGNKTVCNKLVDTANQTLAPFKQVDVMNCFTSDINSPPSLDWLQDYGIATAVAPVGNIAQLSKDDFETKEMWLGKNAKVLKVGDNTVARITTAKTDGILHKKVDVPAGALYMTYDVQNEKPVSQSQLVVLFGGEVLSYRLLGPADAQMQTSEQIYVGDIAGKSADLIFDVPKNPTETPSVLIDNITFYGTVQQQ